MSSGPNPNVFLGRSSYRTRRLRDAVMILPVLGLLLWNLPLVWQGGPGPKLTSSVLIFVFGVWLALIVLALVLARPTMPGDAEGKESGPR